MNIWNKSIAGFVPVKNAVTSTKKKIPFHSQLAAYRKLRAPKHVILNAPTGWGKSMVIMMLCVYRMLRHRKLRVIIAVPQTIISKGFVGGVNDDCSIKVGGRWHDWLAETLCDDSPRKSTQLIAFLLGLTSGRVIVCSHATLLMAYAKLKKRGKLSAFRNAFVWIDEAHHAKNAQGQTGKTRANTLGTLVSYFVENHYHLGLATATFMRGDRCHIVSDEMEKQFTKVYIPYDEYFDERKPFQGLRFHIKSNDSFKALRTIFKNKFVPTIIYLAKRQSHYADKCKYQMVNQIIECLAKTLGAKIDRSNGLIQLIAKHRVYKVLDLVHEDGRHHRKKQLEECDIIIALDMCKEGFDWPKAQRSIIFGERHSVPEMIQMIGRLFRSSPGKEYADIFQILPGVVKMRRFKEHRNRRLSVIFQAMLLEKVFTPMLFRDVGRRKTSCVRLAELISDANVFDRLLREYISTVADMSWEESLPHCAPMLKKYGIGLENQHKVWRTLRCMLAQQTLRQRGLAVNVPWDILKNTSIIEGLAHLYSDLIGPAQFKEWRKSLGSEKRTPEQWVPIAWQLARDNAAGKLVGT